MSMEMHLDCYGAFVPRLAGDLDFSLVLIWVESHALSFDYRVWKGEQGRLRQERQGKGIQGRLRRV